MPCSVVPTLSRGEMAHQGITFFICVEEIMGRRVMVIYDNQEYGTKVKPFPPVGTLGTVISEMDEEFEFDVMFDNYPCSTTLPDESWVTHRLMVVFIDDTSSLKDNYTVVKNEDNRR